MKKGEPDYDEFISDLQAEFVRFFAEWRKQVLKEIEAELKLQLKQSVQRTAGGQVEP